MPREEKVLKYFTRSAAAFDSLYSEEKVSPFMRFLNRRFRGDICERYFLSLEHVRRYGLKSVLDVGCGSGRYALGLSDLGVERIVGVDFSHQMIELASENTRSLRNSGKKLELVCCDFNQFQAEAIFDVIIAMGVFDYMDNPLSALNKMKSFANHSVIASFPSISFYRTPIRKIRYFLKRCPVYFYSNDKIQSLAAEVGFSRFEIEKIEGAGMDYFVRFFK